MLETGQYMITLMDVLRLGQKAMDEVFPYLNSLLDSMNKLSRMPADWTSRDVVKKWYYFRFVFCFARDSNCRSCCSSRLITIQQMKATDELDDAQVRQMLFDLDAAYQDLHHRLTSGQ